MSDKPPAFQFYPKDLLTDDAFLAMSDEECGIFFRLLCYDWINDGIPTDLVGIGKLLRKPLGSLRRCWMQVGPCFKPHPNRPDRLTNPRLESERDKQRSFKERQALNGAKGGRPKNQTEKENPSLSEKETQTKPNENPSLSKTKTQTKPKKSSSSAYTDTNVSGENAESMRPYQEIEAVLKGVAQRLSWADPQPVDIRKFLRPDSHVRILISEGSIEEAISIFCFARDNWSTPPTWSSVCAQRNQIRDQIRASKNGGYGHHNGEDRPKVLTKEELEAMREANRR